MGLPDYAELRCVSNFSFLRGASQPEELVERAKQLGYTALAITDECSLAGVVRAHVAAKEHQLKLLIGSQFQVDPDASEANAPAFALTVLACHMEGYGNLSEFITKLRRVSEKGTYRLPLGAFREVAYDTRELFLRKGDLLFFYTDGFTEAMDGEMNPFGEERLMASLEARKGGTLDEVAQGVLADIRDHVGGAEQYDDMTFLFLRVEQGDGPGPGDSGGLLGKNPAIGNTYE